MSNNFFSNRDRIGFKIPFDVPWVYKPHKKQFTGQASEPPPIPMCRGELGITGCILKEPRWFFDNQRNTGRLTPTEAGVHVSHYPLNKLSESSFAPQVVASFVSSAAISDPVNIDSQRRAPHARALSGTDKVPLSSAPFPAIHDFDLSSPWSSPLWASPIGTSGNPQKSLIQFIKWASWVVKYLILYDLPLSCTFLERQISLAIAESVSGQNYRQTLRIFGGGEIWSIFTWHQFSDS